MGLIDKAFGALGYIRYKDGSHFNFKRSADFLSGDKLKIATDNPVTAACINIRAQILSQVEFYIEGANGEMEVDHEIIKLINNPNPLQSKQDFLKQYEWFKCVYGWVYQKPYGSVGFTPDYLYNLNSGYIDFPDDMKSTLLIDKQEVDDYFAQKFKYTDETDTEKYFELKSIIPFYDVTNGLTCAEESGVTGKSKIDTVIKNISNIGLAGEAENIIIQSNGREGFSNEGKGSNLGSSIPLDKDDKNQIESRLMNNYGFGRGKRRSIATQNPLHWQSYHIKHSDLGFSEIISTNATLVREIFGVPNELYSAHKTGATFENQKEALIGFVQNVMQPVANDIANSWTSYFDLEDTPIKATFKNMPVMQHTEQKKADKVLKIATAYEKLVRAEMDTETIEALFENQGITITDED